MATTTRTRSKFRLLKNKRTGEVHWVLENRNIPIARSARGYVDVWRAKVSIEAFKKACQDAPVVENGG